MVDIFGMFHGKHWGRMSWELTIYKPDRGESRTLTENDASGIVGGFKWVREANGDCTSLSFDVVNSIFYIGARNLIKLEIDGTAQFFGIVTDPPPLASVDRVTVTVYGGREILRKALSDQKVYRKMGVYQIVRDLLGRCCPPALQKNDAYIGGGSGQDAGSTIDLFFMPNQDLEKVLNALAASAGVDWSVNPLGIIEFGRPTSDTLVIPYAGQNFKSLNIEGREVCTEARVNIMTSASVPQGFTVNFYREGVPGQVYMTATSPDNAMYRAAKSVTPPEGVSLVVPLPYESPGTYNKLANMAALSDGDPSTYVAVTLNNWSNSLEVMSQYSRPLGIEITFEVISADGLEADSFGMAYNSPSSASAGLINQTAGRQTVRILLPPAAPNDVPQYRGRFSLGARIGYFAPVPAAEVRVYSFAFLHSDDAAAYQQAVSNLVAPYTTPVELTLNTLVQPRRSATITGTPQGDVTGPTAQFEYEHQSDRLRSTKVKLGSTGTNDTVKAIRFTAESAVRRVIG